MSIGWGDGENMLEASNTLKDYADKQGAEGIAAVRFTSFTEISISTRREYSAGGGYGDVAGRSTTRWVAYGTLIKRG
jgi:hypothetical protein